jgi:hypothetical protein
MDRDRFESLAQFPLQLDLPAQRGAVQADHGQRGKSGRVRQSRICSSEEADLPQ